MKKKKNIQKKLEAQKAKIKRNGGTAKRVGDALAQVNKQIKKVRDEDNTITY